MPNSNDTVTVQILDKNYNVKCPASERQALQNAVNHLERAMLEAKESSKLATPERLAILVALNATHDYQALRGEQSDFSKKYTHKINELEKQIKKTLTQSEQMEL